MTDTYTRDVLTGVAALLDASGAGVYRDGADPVYTTDERPIIFKPMDFPGAPPQQIILTRYNDDPGQLAINDVYLQVRTRASSDPLDAEDLTDLIRDTLHDKTHVVLNGRHFNWIRQFSFAYLGPNSNGNLEFTQNFRLTGNRYAAK